MIRAEDLEPGNIYLAELVEAVDNPAVDRRVKHDWTALPQFEAGRLYSIVLRDLDRDRDLVEGMTSLVVEISHLNYYTSQCVPAFLYIMKAPLEPGRSLEPHQMSRESCELLIEHLRLVEPTVMERVALAHRFRSIDAIDIVDALAESGILTHNLLSMTLQAIEERYEREAIEDEVALSHLAEEHG